MKSPLISTLALAGILLAPVVALAAEDNDSDRTSPKAFVTDSVITTKIKTKLAAEHLTSLAHIRVDTDKNGVVWLNGTAKTQETIDKAVTLARDTENVKSVHNGITVKMED